MKTAPTSWDEQLAEIDERLVDWRSQQQARLAREEAELRAELQAEARQQSVEEPEVEFRRLFCPELAGVPKVYLAEPHRMSGVLQEKVGCQIGKDYPRPVVMHREAYAMARQRMGEIRKRPEVRAESFRVQERHGSRRRGRKRKR